MHSADALPGRVSMLGEICREFDEKIAMLMRTDAQ
jgi:hypothetical protein